MKIGKRTQVPRQTQKIKGNEDREADTSSKANTKNQCRMSGWTHVSNFFKESREQPIQVISSPTLGEQVKSRFPLSFWSVFCFWKTKEPSCPPQTSSAEIFDCALHSDLKTQRLKNAQFLQRILMNIASKLHLLCICTNHQK